ncbi:hypothetical protein AAGS61_10020 [Lysinibacillus sp. KU-BSD001]|uniref:tubby C-terminal domain-like protein n=1 Tax=Lysinibacillus sp. KU-BSD001 TaxID=3141328 RepID=UPI0036F1589D
MLYLFLLFIVSQIGIGLRFWLKGIFEPSQFFLSCMFLFAGVGIYFLQEMQSKKDVQFKSVSDENLWQTRLTERMKTTKKKLTKGHDIIFYYNRYYRTVWQRLYVELLNAPDKYIHVTFSNENKQVDWQELSKFSSSKANWKITENGHEIAQARYKSSLKDKVNFEERLQLTVAATTYEVLSYKMSNQILIYREGQKIGEGDLSKLVNGHLQFRIHDQQEELLAMAVIIFHYLHKSG